MTRYAIFPLFVAGALALSSCSNKNFNADVADFIEDHNEWSTQTAQKSHDQTIRLNEALRKAEYIIVQDKAVDALAAAYNPDLPIEERIKGAFDAGNEKARAEGRIAEAKRVEEATAQNLLDAHAELAKWMEELAEAYEARDEARIKLAKDSIVKAQEIVTKALADWEALEQRKEIEAELAAEKKRADELQALHDQAKAEAEAERSEPAPPPANPVAPVVPTGATTATR